MSKIKKIDRIAHLEFQVTWLTNSMNELLGTENLEFEPQLKQLDQSVFDGLDEKWRFAAVDGGTNRVYVYEQKPHLPHGGDCWGIYEGLQRFVGEGYDTSNWQNSLIERDTAKELTGSDLARTYFESNDRHVCFVGEDNDDCLSDLVVAVVIGYNEYRGFETSYNDWFPFAMLVNRQGEPLTAAEAGL